MIVNVGNAQDVPVLDISEDDMREIFDVKFMGVWNYCTFVAKQMTAQGPGTEGSTC